MDHARMYGVRDQLAWLVDGFNGGFVRMDSNRAPDVGVRLCNGAHASKPVETRADRQHANHARMSRAIDHAREVAAEFGVIQVAVAVYEHVAMFQGLIADSIE